ncbi:MAG: M23 family metallopeptidase [Balneola sp.]
MKIIFIPLFLGMLSFSPLEEITLISPVNHQFEIVSKYGMRFHPILQYERLHNGVDYATPIGTKVYASATGKVEYVGKKGNLGEVVIIDHGKGIKTLYANLLEAMEGLQEGNLVQQGEQIAKSGNTGLTDEPHLHFMIFLNENAVDPEDFLTSK